MRKGFLMALLLSALLLISCAAPGGLTASGTQLAPSPSPGEDPDYTLTPESFIEKFNAVAPEGISIDPDALPQPEYMEDTQFFEQQIFVEGTDEIFIIFYRRTPDDPIYMLYVAELTYTDIVPAPSLLQELFLPIVNIVYPSFSDSPKYWNLLLNELKPSLIPNYDDYYNDISSLHPLHVFAKAFTTTRYDRPCTVGSFVIEFFYLPQ